MTISGRPDGTATAGAFQRSPEDDSPNSRERPRPGTPPRASQCYGQQAAEFNARLVAGEQVRLVRDVEQRDRYGRLLAYVYRVGDGLFVNAELARRGYAQPLAIPPDVRHAERFAKLAREAREHGRGLWSAC